MKLSETGYLRNPELRLKSLHEAVEVLQSKFGDAPETAIILGTGLGNLTTKIENPQELEYTEIPHFPLSTVESHLGILHVGQLAGKRVVALQGRFHFYEGYSMQEVAFPVNVLGLWGIKRLFISNAAGALNPAFKKGNLMLITDHINLFRDNPLIGPNIDELGTRFPDMSEAYHKGLNVLLRNAAAKLGLSLREGVYVTAPGPMLETPAEYRYLRRVGGDAVGMSTVPEVITAVHLGIPVAAISVLTDECDPENLAPINVPEILRVSREAEKDLSAILMEVISQNLPRKQ